MWNTAILFHYFLRDGGAAPGSSKTVQKAAESFNEKWNELSQKTLKNQNWFCITEECNPLPQGVQKTLNYIQHRQFHNRRG